MALAGNATAIYSFETGNTLLRNCESNGGMDYGDCVGYLKAVSDGIRYNKGSFPNASHPERYIHNDICTPDGITAGQLVKVWVKWANDNPQHLHLATQGLVMAAFAEAWPC